MAISLPSCNWKKLSISPHLLKNLTHSNNSRCGILRRNRQPNILNRGITLMKGISSRPKSFISRIIALRLWPSLFIIFPLLKKANFAYVRIYFHLRNLSDFSRRITLMKGNFFNALTDLLSPFSVSEIICLFPKLIICTQA